jgi:hypothetical protein
LAAGPAVRGTVVFGPASRIIAQFGDDQLQVFYILDVVNTARTPVDIGGPLIIDLPREARGAALVDGASPQASVAGARVTVVGPFAPGTTPVNVGFDMPYRGPTARIEQQWPAVLPQATVLVAQTGQFVLRSPQFENTRDLQQDGQRVIVGTGPAIGAGQTLTFEIDGLPHHATWPRTVALALAGLIMAAGVWGAVTAPRQVALH